MAANFTSLDRYIDRQVEAVAGYFGPVEAAAIDAVGRWQVEQRIGEVRLFSVDGATRIEMSSTTCASPRPRSPTMA